MDHDANAGDGSPATRPGRADPADEARLVEIATALADGVEAALPGWVERSVERIWAAWCEQAGGDPDLGGDLRDRTRAAGAAAQAAVAPEVRRLLLTDLDDQRTTPLAVLEGAIAFPTTVLRDAGVPPVRRDAPSERRFPDDDYDLAIVAYADLDPDLAETGLVWGAAKAHVHLARRRAEGRR